MFKILKSLSKSLTGGKTAEKEAGTAETGRRQRARQGRQRPASRRSARQSLVSAQNARGAVRDHPKMSKSEIHARLKLLYKRYNRAASSLNAQTREEADAMLNAIVEVREKHFGTI